MLTAEGAQEMTVFSHRSENSYQNTARLIESDEIFVTAKVCI